MLTYYFIEELFSHVDSTGTAQWYKLRELAESVNYCHHTGMTFTIR